MADGFREMKPLLSHPILDLIRVESHSASTAKNLNYAPITEASNREGAEFEALSNTLRGVEFHLA
jgi:hypothetical protein